MRRLHGNSDVQGIAADAAKAEGLHLVAVSVSSRLMRPGLAAHDDDDWLTSYRRIVLDAVQAVTGAASHLRGTRPLAIVIVETHTAAPQPQVAATAAAHAALPAAVHALAAELADHEIRVLAVVPTRETSYQRERTNKAVVDGSRGRLRPVPIYFAHPPTAAQRILRLADQSHASGTLVSLPSGMLPLELPIRPVRRASLEREHADGSRDVSADQSGSNARLSRLGSPKRDARTAVH
jgi:NAD(P)-dependent dehydrogenase (short-subunit alcohol dehydrogenase family)